MNFHLNERVAFLREKGYAIVKSISKNKLLVLDDDGFERNVHADELVKIIANEFFIETQRSHHSEKDNCKKEYKPNVKKQKKKQEGTIDFLEIDLHIEKLPDEILNTPSLHYIELQMKALRHFIEKAKKNRLSYFVVIHGVGDGILKNEVLSYLSKFEYFKIDVADHTKYGNGATKVLIDKRYF
jgi:hypothetical protein